MTLHAIRVEVGKISRGPPIPTLVGNLLTSRRTVLPEMESELSLYEPTDTEALDAPYYAGTWRFPDEDYDVDELLDAFENVLRGPAKWYRVRYHLCYDDDPEDPRGCEWDDSKTRLGGDVPNALPGRTSAE